jgi:hypothetical protein
MIKTDWGSETSADLNKLMLILATEDFITLEENSRKTLVM